MFDPFIEACVLRDLVARREIRPREVAETYLRRIEELNPKLDAFVTVTARARARRRRAPRIDRAGLAAALRRARTRSRTSLGRKGSARRSGRGTTRFRPARRRRDRHAAPPRGWHPAR